MPRVNENPCAFMAGKKYPNLLTVLMLLRLLLNTAMRANQDSLDKRTTSVNTIARVNTVDKFQRSCPVRMTRHMRYDNIGHQREACVINLTHSFAYRADEKL